MANPFKSLEKKLQGALKSDGQGDRYSAMDELVGLALQDDTLLSALKYIAHGKKRKGVVNTVNYGYNDQAYAFDGLVDIAKNRNDLRENISEFIEGCFKPKERYLCSRIDLNLEWMYKVLLYDVGGEFASKLVQMEKIENPKEFFEAADPNTREKFVSPNRLIEEPKPREYDPPAYAKMGEIRERVRQLK